MFGFIRKMFFLAMTFFYFDPLNASPLETVSMNNQECRTRAKIMNVNNNEPVFYPFSIRVNKCSGSCNNINDPNAKLCVPDIVKDINVKVFNLMSWINQTRYTEWHKICKCKCRLDAGVCRNKQRWNEGKFSCECREELIDKGRCDKGFIWNPSSCNCECNKSCGIGEYLDHKNCKCRRKIAGALVDKCNKNSDDNEMIHNGTLDAIPLNDYKKVCSYLLYF